MLVFPPSLSVSPRPLTLLLISPYPPATCPPSFLHPPLVPFVSGVLGSNQGFNASLLGDLEQVS